MALNTGMRPREILNMRWEWEKDKLCKGTEKGWYFWFSLQEALENAHLLPTCENLANKHVVVSHYP
ncbi:MAG: hypothetical protein ACUZ77_10500 [Candidatus Brocadiales bacterium]